MDQKTDVEIVQKMASVIFSIVQRNKLFLIKLEHILFVSGSFVFIYDNSKFVGH